MRRIHLAFPLLLFLGCLHSPQALEEPGTDTQDFINVFEAYEERCPYFTHKDMDWKEIGEIYYPLAALCETQDELRGVIAEMLVELQDPAIYLYKTNEFGEIVETAYPYIQEHETNVDMDVLVEQYLEPNGWAGWEEGYSHGFGWCDPAILPYAFLDSIVGYDFLPEPNSLDPFIAECIELDVPAIILDIRMNPYVTSSSESGHQLMGRFAAKSYPGAIYRSRSGPEYNQYTDIRPAVYPAGPLQYTGTVILLVGENCNQDSESMTANFINFPNVVLVGDTTRGSVSSMSYVSIADDWYCKVVCTTTLTYDKFWIEGAGIPPDIYVEATDADFAAGVDPVMDYAMAMLEDYR